jgi:type I restriction enzyme, S subunit
MVRAGYKQTEVGEIPEDWGVSDIKSFSKTGSGTTPARAQENRYFKNGRHHWVKTTDLNNSAINVTEDKVTDFAIKETCLQIYPKYTVLVAMYGGFNQIGRTGILSIPAAVNQALVAVQVNKATDSRYLLYTLNYKVDYWKSVASSSRKDPNITSTDVKNFKLALPPTRAEQNVISKALSDVDELIVSLEKLIAKKRDIKTGTMQQLLTGKKRLAGFGEGKGYKQTELGEIPEDWDVKTYDDVFSFYTTASNSRDDLSENGLISYIHYGDIHTKWNITLDMSISNLPGIDRHKFKGAAFIKDGDVIMADASEDYEGIGKSIEVCGIGEKKCIAGLHTFLLRDRDYTYVDGFRGYLHMMTAVKASFDRLATGLKVYGLSKNTLKTVHIPVPPKKEQERIVEMLSGMTEEIGSLSDRLKKTKAIKQGMMQELLTGRTRMI